MVDIRGRAKDTTWGSILPAGQCPVLIITQSVHMVCTPVLLTTYSFSWCIVLEFREPTPPIKQFGVSIEVWEIFKCSQKLSFGRAICHPASCYVQGVNDLATPLLVVFLSEHLEGDLDSWVLTTLSPEITFEVGWNSDIILAWQVI